MQLQVIAFLAGVVGVQQLSTLPAAAWGWLLILLPFVYRCVKPVRVPSLVAAGFLWALLHAHVQLHPPFDPQLAGRDLPVTGVVASIPERSDRALRFDFDVDAERPAGVPDRLRLSWYGAAASDLRAGDRWQLTLRLREPSGFRNPGGFDYEAWLFQHGIRATGYVREKAERRRLGEAGGPYYRVQRLRQSLLEALHAALPDGRNAGVLAALAVGHRADIPTAHWDLLIATGTNHLMAISGLHVGLVAGLAGLLALRLWRLSARLCLWLAAPRAAALAGLAAGFVYALLAGFAIPTQRALVMLTVVAAALAWGRIGTPSRTLALALLAVLLLDPLSVLSPGFWLSFAAVAVILYALTGRRAGHPLAWLRIQVVIAIGLLPLTVWFFQFGAVVSPLANLIAVPWVGFVVVPSTLLGAALAPWMPAVAGLPLWLADAALDLLWPVLEWLAALPGGQWLPPAPPFVWLLLALAGGALLLAPRGWPARWLGAVLLLPMLTWQPPAPAEGDFRFTLLEVGQGLAAVIETRRHLLVYDTGPRFSDRFDAGEAAIHPYLVHRGRRRVDRLILSHGDDDHAGGAASLLARVPVGEVLGDTGDRDDLPSPRPCKAGEAWRWDGVDFELLHPPRGWRGDNEASCVLRVAAAGGSLLLTGDIERLAEAAMLRERREALAAEVMLIPHHGALTSSTPAFIDAVRPRLAVVSSGYGNRFGHPRPEILALYRERDIPVLDTAREGAITLRFEVDGLAIEPGYRHAVRRYWHRP